MGKKKDETAEGSARKGSNFDPEKAMAFVDRIETLKHEQQVFKEDAAASCAAVKLDIDEVYAEAETAGISPAYLKTALKRRKLKADAEALDEKFAGTKKDEYHALLLALGELGEAAIKKAA